MWRVLLWTGWEALTLVRVGTARAEEEPPLPQDVQTLFAWWDGLGYADVCRLPLVRVAEAYAGWSEPLPPAADEGPDRRFERCLHALLASRRYHSVPRAIYDFIRPR